MDLNFSKSDGLIPAVGQDYSSGRVLMVGSKRGGSQLAKRIAAFEIWGAELSAPSCRAGSGLGRVRSVSRGDMDSGRTVTRAGSPASTLAAIARSRRRHGEGLAARGAIEI